MPNPWMIVAAVLLVASLTGGGYLYGELHSEAACAQKVADVQKKILDENNAAWEKSYAKLDERYKNAIDEGNVLTAQVREKNSQIENLQADLRQDISHVVTDRQECRVPVSIIDRINGLSGFGVGGPLGATPKPKPNRVPPTR